MGVFDEYYDDAFPYQFQVTILVGRLVGGVPADDKIAEGWVKTKLKNKDDLTRERVMQEVIAKQIESGGEVDPNALNEAVKDVAAMKGLNVFWRDSNGLYIEGRCAAAMLKESANSVWPGRTWGNKMSSKTGEPIGKQTKSWFPEHVYVPDTRIYLGREQEDDVMTRFVTSRYGTSISQEAYCDGVKLSFGVHTDHNFSAAEWAKLWLHAGNVIGIGASRSQQYGKFEILAWDNISSTKKKTTKSSAPKKAAAAEAQAPAAKEAEDEGDGFLM